MQERIPQHGNGFTHYATMLADEGSYDEAEATIGRGLARLPGDRGLLVARATLARKRGDLREAIRGWETVIKHHPGG